MTTTEGQGPLVGQKAARASIVARLAGAPSRARRSVIGLLLLTSCGAAFVAVEFSFADPELAAWWPAAGLASMAGMLARGRERWLVIALVVAATGVGNLLAGRELLFALLLGVGNAVEVAIIAALLAPAGVPTRLATVRQATRFIGIALLAAAAAGIALALVALIFVQRPFGEGFVQLSASHASATLVMLPLVMVPLRHGRLYPWPEIALQSTVLTAVIALVFWPDNSWPVAFTPIVVFLWSAFRFPMLVTAIQMIATTIAVIVLTTLGGGPFAAFEDGSRTQVLLIQLFIVVYATMALIVCAARADWFALVSRLREQEELLRVGIGAADVGIFIAERTENELVEVARNERARRAIGNGGPPFGIAAIDRALDAATSGQVAFRHKGRTFDASIVERDSHGGPALVTMVITDVTERNEREKLALESVEQLRRLNAQKDDFISSVSHELRTPVTSIIGFSEILDDHDLSPDAAQAGEIIARNARRLADVIDDVLELSSLTALGGPRSDAEPVDIVAFVRECARDADGLAVDRRISILVDAPDEALIVRSRPRELNRVCANLLSNAVKFSHLDSTITIEARPDRGGGARVRVIDHGLGIPAEHRDMVWERFARAPVDAHREVPGTGLGLPIVKALVEQRLGGSVVLVETLGGGTTAEVRLPAVAPAVSLLHDGA